MTSNADANDREHRARMMPPLESSDSRGEAARAPTMKAVEKETEDLEHDQTSSELSSSSGEESDADSESGIIATISDVIVRRPLQLLTDADDTLWPAGHKYLFSLSLSAVCRESVCQDMSLAVLSDDPKVSVFKCQNGSLCNTKTNLKIWLRMWHRLGVHFVHQKGP